MNLKRIPEILKDIKSLKRSPLFDGDFYRSQTQLPQYSVPELEYLRRWREYNQTPSPFFDQDHYLNTNPDVKAAEINPLLHYIHHGLSERRSPLPNFDMNAFFDAHPNLKDGSIEPILYCIKNYGTPHWEKNSARIITYDKTRYTKSEMIEARALFDADFYQSMYATPGNKFGDPFMHYLNVGAQTDCNPYPNFDSAYYQSEVMDLRKDYDIPLLHYVKIGRDLGVRTSRTNTHVFTKNSPEIVNTPRVLVHAHMYYPEIIKEFLHGFHNFPKTVKFVITTCTSGNAGMIRSALITAGLDDRADVEVVTNQGRDILPFLKVLAMYKDKADFVLHVHSKVSPHISWGEAWRHYLIEMTMGSTELVQSAIATLSNPDSNVGCLFPENYHKIKVFLNEDHNSGMLQNLVQQYGLTQTLQDRIFPASSFAWYRISALEPLLEFGYTDNDFDTEDGQVDGTLAHAFERLLPMIVRGQGFSVDYYTAQQRPHLKLDDIVIPSREASVSVATNAWVRDTPIAAAKPLIPLNPIFDVFNGKQLDIHWVVPSFAKGAGGHMSIFRIVRYLEQFGHNQTIWLQNAFNHSEEATAYDRIRAWYQPIGDRVSVRFLPEDVAGITGDVLIATDAWTAFPASQMPGFLERFYFIQDVESQFHPTGENQLTIDQTYKFGFSALTAGPWLKTFAEGHGMWVRDWPLCADLDVYKTDDVPLALPTTGPIKIAFYARQYTPRRAVRLGYATFEELHRRGVDFHVYLFGEENLTNTGDYPQTQMGILSPEELASLYQKSDIGVVFSTTNYSLLPLEMAACGLPVVDLDVDSMRSVFSGDEITLAQPTPYGVADAIEALIENPDLMQERRQSAMEMAQSYSWEDSARRVEAAMIERLTEQGYKDVSLQVAKLVESPALMSPVRASVVIPTYNGGADFKSVLDAVCHQKIDLPYDVIVIDSNSKDSTSDVVKSAQKSSGNAKDVRLISIKQSEFQHGATRNRGIAESDGSHVAIITQDAQPANDMWLQNLLGGFSYGDRVAGVTGRHRAYPQHDAFIQRDMEGHFDRLQSLGRCLSRSGGLSSLFYPMSQAWQMLLYFYSDNNSAIAKAAWEHCPYPEVDWGEDYVWARKMMNLGWQKAYVDSALVYHSHDFEGEKTLSAAIEEGRFWKTHFGFTLHHDADADITAALQRDKDYAKQANVDPDALVKREKYIRAQILGRIKGAK